MDESLKDFIDTTNKLLIAQGQVIENLNRKVEDLSRKVAIAYNRELVRNKGINKEMVCYEIDKYISGRRNCECKDNLKKHSIVISLTTFPARMYEIKYALYSLVNQTIRADHIVLWLTEEEFPNREKDISIKLLETIRQLGVEIRWADKNHKAYNKIIYSLKEFPDSIIVTADDDIYYPENWLEILYLEYLEHGCVCAHRCHKIKIEDDNLQSYNSWGISECGSYSYLNFITGVGGVLYYPGCFYDDVLNEDLYLKASPNNDDIWLWAMILMNGNRIRVPQSAISSLKYVNAEREYGLSGERRLGAENLSNKRNDQQLINVINLYPELSDRMLEDSDN